MIRKNLIKSFKRPKKIIFEHNELSDVYAKFSAYPFERGYGTTIGNSLRRILLSSIQGYAVTAIRITTNKPEGESHVISSEFEAIPSVLEDTPEIINNLKQLQIWLPDNTETRLIQFDIHGALKVTGTMLQVDNDLKIFNEDFHILTTTEEANMNIEIQIELGRGYVPSEVNAKNIEVVGAIPIDAIFSPVKRVKYEIKNTRIGQRTDYEKLDMEIWTDGTTSPERALAEASVIAREHYNTFVIDGEENILLDTEHDEEDEALQRTLDISVDELELSVRSSNCLQNANIRTLGDLTAQTESKIMETPNFGKKSMEEIKEKLIKWNLRLGMTDRAELRQALLHTPKNVDKDNSDET